MTRRMCAVGALGINRVNREIECVGRGLALSSFTPDNSVAVLKRSSHPGLCKTDPHAAHWVYVFLWFGAVHAGDGHGKIGGGACKRASRHGHRYIAAYGALMCKQLCRDAER